VNLTKKTSLTQKAYLNALASSLDYGARLVVGFVINPLLVSGLGDYGYGAWQVLGRLIGYVTPASGRPTQALKWTVANQQASTDYDAKRGQVGSAIAVWLMFLPLLLLLGGAIAWASPIWLKAPKEYYPIIRGAAALLVINLVATDLMEIPRSVLTGENLGHKRMGLSTFLVLVGGGLTALAVYLKGGLIGVAVATLIATVLTGILFWQVAQVYVPWFGIAKPVFTAVRQFLKLSVWFQIWNLVMTMMRASDVVLLGILGSAELVTVYSLTKYVPETLINVVAIVVFGITPGLGGIIGAGDLQKAVRVRNEIMSFTWLITTVAGTTIILWNQSFLQLWVGSEYDAGSIPTFWIVLGVTQFVLIRNDANIIDLTLDLRQKVLVGLFSSVLSIVIAAILVHFNLGITGLCVGFLVGRLVLSLVYPWQIGRFLGISFWGQIKGAIAPIVILLLLFGLATHLSAMLKIETWLGLILSSGATFFGLSVLAFYLGLSGHQRQQILKRIRQVTSR
jgi:O-antigen/teichoic acid export membrane protein